MVGHKAEEPNEVRPLPLRSQKGGKVSEKTKGNRSPDFTSS